MAKKIAKETNILSLPKPPKIENKQEAQNIELKYQKLIADKEARLKKGYDAFVQFLHDEDSKIVAVIHRSDLPGIVNTFLSNPEAQQMDLHVGIFPKTK